MPTVRQSKLVDIYDRSNLLRHSEQTYFFAMSFGIKTSTSFLITF